jgi:carbamoyl-phosphate synthase large subunit
MKSGSKFERRVIVAGAAGASLGTETLKALALTGRYQAIAADISSLAYGLYQKEAAASHLLRASNYLEDLIACCRLERAFLVIPSSEPTLKIISGASERLRAEGITAIHNRPEVIRVCSDKGATFEMLQSIGIPVPRTQVLKSEEDLIGFPMPCIIKPATDTGASVMVSPASTHAEALLYAKWIRAASLTAIAQEYLPHNEGEFTVGVLRFDGWIGAIAMKREFPCKLSYIQKSERFLISSGYSQGLIHDFADICEQAKKIAIALDSQGPLNIQGRLVNGVFYPFEINPRFSGTTFFRTMAGFPEIEIYLDHVNGEPPPPQPVIKSGYYLRSFSELHVPFDQIKRLA